MKRFATLSLAVAALACHVTTCQPLFADDSKREGDWISTHDPTSGVLTQTMELILHPKPEPQPALRYRLIPDAFDRRNDNAAIYYLKAMGFFEQTPAFEAVNNFRRQAREAAQQSEQPDQNPAPYAWLTMPPDQLPVQEVKQYLRLLSFQPPFLAEAARCNEFSLERNIREVKDPITYLLPEIQTLRELARTQSLRCRVAIREGAIDDAIAIIGQQYALANHLGQDEFLISNLVGAAVSSIAWTDVLHLLQHPETPNLYWALASLPAPLISTSQAMPTEYNFLFLQVKTLREVDETPRPAGYWQDLIRRMIPEIRLLGHSPWKLSDDPELEHAAVVALIATAYPGAKQYLIEICQIDPALVDSFPTTQAVLLAVRRYYERTRDELFKWNHLPLWQALQSSEYQQVKARLEADSQQLGWITKPTDFILPGIKSIRISISRPQQTIAMLQTVEAIRDYAAHHGRLPPSLADLRYPAPVDPFTGTPVSYVSESGQAVLTSHPQSGVQYRLLLQLAE